MHNVKANFHATICWPDSSESDPYATISRPDFFAQWYRPRCCCYTATGFSQLTRKNSNV